MNKRVFCALNKRASVSGDFWRGAVSSALLGPAAPVLIPAVGAAATASGLSSSEGGKIGALRTLTNYGDDKYLSYVPGVGIHRLVRRPQLINQILAKKDAEHDASSRTLYNALSVINPLNVLAALPAMVAAGITSKRTLAEQKEMADDPNYGLKSMLIPGWNMYNVLKTLGASDRISELPKLTAEDKQSLTPEVVDEYEKLREARKSVS